VVLPRDAVSPWLLPYFVSHEGTVAKVTSTQAESEARDPVVDAYLVHVDRTLIERNLTLSVEERFCQLMELQRFAAELLRAGSRADRP
jgi:hypothetical protein